MGRRATNMGVGERFRVSRYSKEIRPSPDSYAIPSLFNPDQNVASFSRFSRFQKGNKTHCFGAGRDDFRKTVVNAEKKTYADPGNPGPLNYINEKPFG